MMKLLKSRLIESLDSSKIKRDLERELQILEQKSERDLLQDLLQDLVKDLVKDLELSYIQLINYRGTKPVIQSHSFQYLQWSYRGAADSCAHALAPDHFSLYTRQ